MLYFAESANRGPPKRSRNKSLMTMLVCENGGKVSNLIKVVIQVVDFKLFSLRPTYYWLPHLLQSGLGLRVGMRTQQISQTRGLLYGNIL